MLAGGFTSATMLGGYGFCLFLLGDEEDEDDDDEEAYRRSIWLWFGASLRSVRSG